MIPVEANNRIAGVKKDAGGEAIGNRYAGKDAKAGAEEKKGQKIENWILLYNEKIQSGEINACRKIKKVYAKLAADIAAGEEGSAEWFYSEARAQHAIDFIERYCKHSKGKFGGKPVRLELWEKAFIAAIFCFVDIEGRRKYRKVLLIVGKKNGKSLLSSAIGLYLMIADGEPGADVFAVATKRDQAKIIWSEAVRMVKKSPTLARYIKCRVGDMVSELNESSFKPLASDSDTLDGLNVHGALMDEIHQWKNGKALYDIIADGTSAREQPLICITTTAGVIREDIYDAEYEYAEKVVNGYEDENGYHDEQFLPIIYELDNRSEWTEESCWVKANPGLGTIKNLSRCERRSRRRWPTRSWSRIWFAKSSISGRQARKHAAV